MIKYYFSIIFPMLQFLLRNKVLRQKAPFFIIYNLVFFPLGKVLFYKICERF